MLKALGVTWDGLQKAQTHQEEFTVTHHTRSMQRGELRE